MKYLWDVSDLTFPQDKELLKERLTHRFSPLDELTQQYRLEAKYLMAGSTQPFSSIVLSNPNWCEEECLTKLVYKLEEEYGCPVILIGKGGKGITKPDRSFLLKQTDFLLSEWSETGKFTVEPTKIEQVIARWRNLCRNYRPSYSLLELKIEATINHEQTFVKQWNEFYEMVYPFATERPLFCLTAFPVSNEDLRYSKKIELNVRGKKFVCKDQDNPEKLKQWRKVKIAFFVEAISKTQWQGTIVDIQPHV